MKPRKLPYHKNGKRVETGEVQFGDDWPALHIRGDEAFFLLMALIKVLASLPDTNSLEETIYRQQLRSLAEIVRDDVIVGGEKLLELPWTKAKTNPPSTPEQSGSGSPPSGQK